MKELYSLGDAALCQAVNPVSYKVNTVNRRCSDNQIFKEVPSWDVPLEMGRVNKEGRIVSFARLPPLMRMFAQRPPSSLSILLFFPPFPRSLFTCFPTPLIYSHHNLFFALSLSLPLSLCLDLSRTHAQTLFPHLCPFPKTETLW